MIELKIVGDDFKHCLYSNNPLPPTSFFNEIKWVWDSPIYSTDVVFYTNSAVSLALQQDVRTKICWLIEPYEFVPNAYDFVKQHNSQFKYVFTHEKTLLDLGQNYRFVPFGGCWINSMSRSIYNKTKIVSIIASYKNQMAGHKLRHDTIRAYKSQLDVYGNGYTPIDKKITALGDYKFSVVIENCKRDYWFTEKLIDALITGTIPIYWGCPSIGDLFDTRGFIIVDNITDIGDTLSMVHSSPTLYNDMKEYMENNYKIAQQYVLAEKFIYEQYILTGELL